MQEGQLLGRELFLQFLLLSIFPSIGEKGMILFLTAVKI